MSSSSTNVLSLFQREMQEEMTNIHEEIITQNKKNNTLNDHNHTHHDRNKHVETNEDANSRAAEIAVCSLFLMFLVACCILTHGDEEEIQRTRRRRRNERQQRRQRRNRRCRSPPEDPAIRLKRIKSLLVRKKIIDAEANGVCGGGDGREIDVSSHREKLVSEREEEEEEEEASKLIVSDNMNGTAIENTEMNSGGEEDDDDNEETEESAAILESSRRLPIKNSSTSSSGERKHSAVQTITSNAFVVMRRISSTFGLESNSEIVQTPSTTTRTSNFPVASFPSYKPTTCSICLEGYSIGDEVTWSKNPNCMHEFHTECIIEWLMTPHDDCPLCRQDFLCDPSKTIKDIERGATMDDDDDDDNDDDVATNQNLVRQNNDHGTTANNNTVHSNELGDVELSEIRPNAS